MKLTKNGITYDLTDTTQIEAFKGSGWTEVESAASTVSTLTPAMLMAMKKEDLVDYAQKAGVDISEARTKEDIISILIDQGGE